MGIGVNDTNIYTFKKVKTSAENASSALPNYSISRNSPSSNSKMAIGKDFVCVLGDTIGAPENQVGASGLFGPKVFCWGGNAYGQLGNNTTISSNIPVAAITTQSSPASSLYGQIAIDIDSSEYSVCVVNSPQLAFLYTTSQKISCWGRNGNGQLGINSTTTSLYPQNIVMTQASPASSMYNKTAYRIFGFKTTNSGSIGSFCSIAKDNSSQAISLNCWGNGASGQMV